MTSFTQYSNVLFDGFISNIRADDQVNKKRSLLTEILAYYNLSADDLLFVGFSPLLVAAATIGESIKVAEISDRIFDHLIAQGYVVERVSLDTLPPKSASVVIAVDEYFTFAETDQQQRVLVDQLAAIARDLIITTLRDYKNQDFRDREFSHPIMVNGSEINKIYLEHYQYSVHDKNAATSTTYVVTDSLETFGPYNRRNMYFKQLAKFSIDAGADSFYVHKNVMYKSVIKKNYEHMITIKF